MSSLPTRVGALVALAAAAGCYGHVQPASGTVAGYGQPVLLGPVDRLGGGQPLAVTKVGEYEAESVALSTQATTADGAYDVTTDMRDESEPYSHAATACAVAGRKADIRLTMLKARSYGTVVGYKNMVDLEGDVVTVGGGK